MIVTEITTTQGHNCYIKLFMNKLMLLEFFRMKLMIEFQVECMTMVLMKVQEYILNTLIEFRTIQLELNWIILKLEVMFTS